MNVVGALGFSSQDTIFHDICASRRARAWCLAILVSDPGFRGLGRYNTVLYDRLTSAYRGRDLGFRTYHGLIEFISVLPPRLRLIRNCFERKVDPCPVPVLKYLSNLRRERHQ